MRRQTQLSHDAGLDVLGTGVSAQVKFEALPVGRPTLQQLRGAAPRGSERVLMFFSSAGYTPQATSWASDIKMALFQFSLDGSIEPINAEANKLLKRADANALQGG